MSKLNALAEAARGTLDMHYTAAWHSRMSHAWSRGYGELHATQLAGQIWIPIEHRPGIPHHVAKPGISGSLEVTDHEAQHMTIHPANIDIGGSLSDLHWPKREVSTLPIEAH